MHYIHEAIIKYQVHKEKIIFFSYKKEDYKVWFCKAQDNDVLKKTIKYQLNEVNLDCFGGDKPPNDDSFVNNYCFKCTKGLDLYFEHS